MMAADPWSPGWMPGAGPEGTAAQESVMDQAMSDDGGAVRPAGRG